MIKRISVTNGENIIPIHEPFSVVFGIPQMGNLLGTKGCIGSTKINADVKAFIGEGGKEEVRITEKPPMTFKHWPRDASERYESYITASLEE